MDEEMAANNSNDKSSLNLLKRASTKVLPPVNQQSPNALNDNDNEVEEADEQSDNTDRCK